MAYLKISLVASSSEDEKALKKIGEIFFLVRLKKLSELTGSAFKKAIKSRSYVSGSWTGTSVKTGKEVASITLELPPD